MKTEVCSGGKCGNIDTANKLIEEINRQ